MTHPIRAFLLAAVAALFSSAGLGQAMAAPAIAIPSPKLQSDIVLVEDGDGLAREGARIIRRDRDGKHRGERSRRHDDARRHRDGNHQAHRRDRDKRFSRRRHQDDRLGYNRAEPGKRLGYNRDYDDGHAYDGRNGPRFLHRRRDGRSGWHDDDFGDRHRHPRRVYEMESFGYSAEPRRTSPGHRDRGPARRLSDVLTAVPD